MQFGKIENYKITGTCRMQTDDFPDEIPDALCLGDYLISGTIYPASEYANKIPTVEESGVTWTDDLSTLKPAKALSISQSFTSEISTGSFKSTALGIDVDCRRSDTKNDNQNVTGLLSRMGRESIDSVTYIGVSESCTATKSQVQALLYEMEDHVAALYAKKWALEEQIEAATNAEELSKITW